MDIDKTMNFKVEKDKSAKTKEILKEVYEASDDKNVRFGEKVLTTERRVINTVDVEPHYMNRVKEFFDREQNLFCFRNRA